MGRTTKTLALGLGVTLGSAGCGGPTPGAGHATHPGEVSLAATLDGEPSVSLLVDYAAAGLTVCDYEGNEGTLVLFGSFRDGRVSESLDLATMSLSIDLAEIPVDEGAVDYVLDASRASLFLESSSWDQSQLLPTSDLHGELHLRYDAPPRPGVTIRGVFNLLIDNVELANASSPRALSLEGTFDVPVARSCP